MIQWPQSVVEAAARRRVIVVLGAGSSFHATPRPGSSLPPDWRTFLETAARTIAPRGRSAALRLIRAGEYLTACEIVKNCAGDDWPALVQRAFGNCRLDYGKLHEYVYSLDLPLVITTNVDRVYQAAALRLSDATVMVKSYTDADLALLARGRRN